MYKVWFINYARYSDRTFNNIKSAYKYGKRRGLEFRVDRKQTGKLMANPTVNWSRKDGTTRLSGTRRK